MVWRFFAYLIGVLSYDSILIRDQCMVVLVCSFVSLLYPANP